MSPNRSLRCELPAFILLAALLFTSLPVHAASARRSGSALGEVAALGEEAIAWVHDFFGSLWTWGATRERISIAPDGQPKEGVTIDPNGSH